MWQNKNSIGRQFAEHRHNKPGLLPHSEPMYRCIQLGRARYLRW